MNLFESRRAKHDELENKVMDMLRPYTTRRHLPDRFISFNNKLYAWDFKTNVFVEKNSHDEYFRIFMEDGIPVFIVYLEKMRFMAEWITRLDWNGPLPPSAKSTSGDPYYIISGGLPLLEFVKQTIQKETVKA